MTGHTLAKLYATIIEEYISKMAHARGFRAGNQVSFRRDHRTTNHILTLNAIIEEARFRKAPVFCCFVDFRKAFDTVPHHRLMDRLWRLGVPKTEILTILTLYETLSSRVRTPKGLSDNILCTIGVK